jgi:hypothetical protein
MIESNFPGIFCSKTVAPFQRQFDFGVETLDDAAGVAFDAFKIVEQESSVRSQGAGDFFEWGETGSGDFCAPGVQEIGRPGGRRIRPEVLKHFDEQKSAQGSQGGAFNGPHASALGFCPVAALFEEDPSHFLEKGFQAECAAEADLLAADLIDGLVELFDNVETVEDMESAGQKARSAVEIGLPHVGAQEADAGTELFAKNLKEVVDGGLGAVIADPKQPLAVAVDLIDQSPELVLLADMDLIDPQSRDPGEIAVLNAEVHDPFDGRIDIGPGSTETGGHLGPGKQARPFGQKKTEDIAILMLATGPGDPLNSGTAPGTVNAPGCIDQKHSHGPQGHKTPPAFGLPVIAGSFLATTRTDSKTAFATLHSDLQGRRSGRFCGKQFDATIDKSLDGVKGPQYGFKRYIAHVTGWFTGALSGSASLFLCTLAAGKPNQSSPRTPAAASGAGFGGAQPPSNRSVFTHRFLRRAL